MVISRQTEAQIAGEKSLRALKSLKGELQGMCDSPAASLGTQSSFKGATLCLFRLC